MVFVGVVIVCLFVFCPGQRIKKLKMARTCGHSARGGKGRGDTVPAPCAGSEWLGLRGSGGSNTTHPGGPGLGVRRAPLSALTCPGRTQMPVAMFERQLKPPGPQPFCGPRSLSFCM